MFCRILTEQKFHVALQIEEDATLGEVESARGEKPSAPGDEPNFLRSLVRTPGLDVSSAVGLVTDLFAAGIDSVSRNSKVPTECVQQFPCTI